MLNRVAGWIISALERLLGRWEKRRRRLAGTSRPTLEGTAPGPDTGVDEFELLNLDDDMTKPATNQLFQLNTQTGFYEEEFPKRLICWHHTVGGSAESTYRWWHQSDGRVGTAFILDRDGTILEVFDPKYWAYHLGLKWRYRDNDRRLDQISIGIEIASEGALRSGGELNHIAGEHDSDLMFDPEWLYAYDIDWVGEKPLRRAKKLYNLDDTDKFYKHDLVFRGYKYFDRYEEAQYEGLVELTAWLLEEFNISKQIPAGIGFNRAYADFHGVIGHTHVREDKTDPHPGFDWDRVNSQLGLVEV